MKVGVIGAGYWGMKHVEEYIALGHEVVVADMSKEARQLCAVRFGVETVQDFVSVLGDSDVKAVSVCTPNSTHYSIAKHCLNAGRNVLVEKPLAMSVEQVRELVDLAKDRGVVLTVGHVFRYNNAVRKVKEMIDNYELGDIRIVKLKWTNTERLFEDRDVVFDLAPHPLDIINFLFRKNMDEVACVGNAYRRSKSKGAEVAFVNGMMGDVVVNIELSWLTPPKVREMVVVGSEKSVIVNCAAQTVRVVEGGKCYSVDVVQNNTIRDELKAFIECTVDRKKKNVADGNVGLDIIRMVEICNRAMDEKSVLKFNWR